MMIQVRVGLVRRRELFVYGLNMADITQGIRLAVGDAALVYGDHIVLATQRRLRLGVREDPGAVGLIRLKGIVRNDLCFDGLIMPSENTEHLLGLLRSGLAIAVSREARAPNFVRMYRRAIEAGIVRFDLIERYRVEASKCPVRAAVIEVRELGGGRYFWDYLKSGCWGGCYLDGLLRQLRLGW